MASYTEAISVFYSAIVRGKKGMSEVKFPWLRFKVKVALPMRSSKAFGNTKEAVSFFQRVVLWTLVLGMGARCMGTKKTDGCQNWGNIKDWLHGPRRGTGKKMTLLRRHRDNALTQENQISYNRKTIILYKIRSNSMLKKKLPWLRRLAEIQNSCEWIARDSSWIQKRIWMCTHPNVPHLPT